MVGSIGSGQSFAAFAPQRSLASSGEAGAVGPGKAGQEQGSTSGKAGANKELTDAEEKQVRELKARDREVRAHEQAHARVGGSYASSPTYTFQDGPDGKRYAIGGEVQIDSAPIPGNPEASIRKLDIVIRAALAPSEPSSQDLKVAAQARENKLKAQAELRAQKQAELKGDDGDSSSVSSTGNAESGEAANALSALLQTQEAAQNSSQQNGPGQNSLAQDSLAKNRQEPGKPDIGDTSVRSLQNPAQQDATANPRRGGALGAIQAYQDRILNRDQTLSENPLLPQNQSALLRVGGFFDARTANDTERYSRVA